MKYLRAFLYWIYPQQGVIDSLKAKLLAQERLTQVIKADRQSERNENEKLWKELNKLTGA